MLPLISAQVGETVTVQQIRGKDELRQRMAEMGLTVNSKVTVVNIINGNVILNIKDSRVAIGKQMALRIMY